MQIKV